MCKQLIETNDINDFLFNISANLLSDILFILILFLFTWFLYYFTKRQKLYKFFSITDTKRLNVYLSRLLIQNGGAIGVNGNPASYQGISIVYNEAMAANKFRDNFNYLSPSLSDKPGLLSKILLSDVSVRSKLTASRVSVLRRTGN